MKYKVKSFIKNERRTEVFYDYAVPLRSLYCSDYFTLDKILTKQKESNAASKVNIYLTRYFNQSTIRDQRVGAEQILVSFLSQYNCNLHLKFLRQRHNDSLLTIRKTK